MDQQQEEPEEQAIALEGTEHWRGMLFLEAVVLTDKIMREEWWRVDGLQDRPFHPGNWWVHAIYHPRKPNGRVDGCRVSRWLSSPEDWLAFQEFALIANQRNSRSALTRAARKRQEEEAGEA